MSNLDLVNIHVATRVADRINRDWGWNVCTPDDVFKIARGQATGGDAAVESRVLQELAEYGFES